MIVCPELIIRFQTFTRVSHLQRARATVPHGSYRNDTCAVMGAVSTKHRRAESAIAIRASGLRNDVCLLSKEPDDKFEISPQAYQNIFHSLPNELEEVLSSCQ